jgi:AcrR family transcriptional regulator
VDEKALPGSELERRDSLVALLFRLEAAPGPADLVDLVDEIIGWFRQHPDYEALKQLFTEIVGYALAEQAGFTNEQTALPANDLLEIREMVPERFKRWADEVRAKALAEARAQTLADVLSRQLRRRFGELPPSFTERIQSASGEELDAWMDRVMDAASVSDVFDDKRVN